MEESIPHQTSFRQGRWSLWVDRTDTLPTQVANWGSSPAPEVTHPDPGLSRRSPERLADVTCSAGPSETATRPGCCRCRGTSWPGAGGAIVSVAW